MLTHSMSNKAFPSIPDAKAESIVSEWLDIIKRQECGIISFPPRGDAYRRIQHLISWRKVLRKYLGPNYSKYHIIDCSAQTIIADSPETVSSHLLREVNINTNGVKLAEQFVKALQPFFENGKSISFLIYDSDFWFKDSRMDLLLFLSEIAELEPRIQFLLFCEMDIASEHFLKLNLGTTTLTQNIISVPLYDRDSIKYFIQDLAKFWNVNITSTVAESIINQTGCHTWIAKEAVRLYIKESKLPESFVTKPTIRFKLETIWQQFSQLEQKVLLKIIRKNLDFSPEERSTVAYLSDIGMAMKDGDCLNLSMPVLEEYLKEKAFSRSFTIDPQGEVLLDNQNVSNLFGSLEKNALVCLLSKQGNLVKREELGAAIWKNEQEGYSDWALDRLVSRLRKKIEKIHVDADRLVTHKKAGWLWR